METGTVIPLITFTTEIPEKKKNPPPCPGTFGFLPWK